jgi:hypothetical protein
VGRTVRIRLAGESVQNAVRKTEPS